MRGKADTIDAQAAAAIYDDDPDAIERLRGRIAALEARREQIQTYNKTARMEARLPAYLLKNLAGNLKRQRDRLARLEQEAGS